MNIDDVLSELREIHEIKNRAYGNNLYACERVGIESWKGIVIRMMDKMSRIESYARGEELDTGERDKLVDNLNDIAIYAILARLHYEASGRASD